MSSKRISDRNNIQTEIRDSRELEDYIQEIYENKSQNNDN